eukprot:1913080-Pyramimonas_sp.AAC.1
MDAAGGGSGNTRRARTWGPEQRAPVPFQRMGREAMIWSVANSDLNEFLQAAYVSFRLSGLARERSDEWSLAVLTQECQSTAAQRRP